MSTHAPDGFRAAIRAAGLEPPEHIEPGRLHRFPGVEKSNGNRAAWCLLFEDGMGGCFGDWSSGFSDNWQAKREKPFSQSERVAFMRRVEKARKHAEAERQQQYADAAKRAAAIWTAAAPAPGDHPYLTAKGIAPHGIRVNDDGRLVVPVRDADGNLDSLQFIADDGGKKFLTGGKVSGCYYSIGKPDGVLCIAEGYATGASIHEATGQAVAVAFTANNLEPVARALRGKCPDVQIVVGGDRDESRTGQDKAEAAARAVSGFVAIPPETGQDWNDVHRQHGADAVRAGVEAATSPADIERAENITKLDNGDVQIEHLAKLTPIEYDRIRESEAEKLGVRVSTLDAEVSRAQRDTPKNDTNGASVALVDPEPWPDPVDGKQLLNDLAFTARRYLVLPAGAASAIALWIVHAHAHDSAAISPVVGITSPTPECGKTTLLSLLSALVPRPLPASNITAAALFRAVEKWRPSLLIDEADTYLRESDDLRGVINSGHMRSSAWVIRTVGDDHDPRRFATWAPKAVALIGRLPATLESRAIHIELRRMAAGENVEQLRPDKLKHPVPLCRQAWRWASDNADALRSAEPDMGTLRGRLADNWRHLFSIADLCGGEWPTRARRAAEALSAGRSESTAAIMLLEDLRALFYARHAERLSSSEIVEALGKLEDRPWPEWGRAQKPITTRQLARLLEGFGVRPETLRIDDWRGKGYRLQALEDAFSRYLPSPSVTPCQASNDAGLGPIPSVTDGSGVTDGKSRKSAPDKDCHDVTDEEPQAGADGGQTRGDTFDADAFVEELQQGNAEDWEASL
jgi:putative DNA primase/helicase